jgi:transposase InsO family protein
MVAAPNQKWLTDITEAPCSDGKLYVAPVLDCFNGEIVGLTMDDNRRKELCISAFENTCWSQAQGGMIFTVTEQPIRADSFANASNAMTRSKYER